MIFRVLTTLFILIFISGCGDHSNNYDPEPVEEETELEDSVIVFKPFVEVKYENNPEQFFENTGKPCTYDCSGHEAGYEWAEKKDISDLDDCSGNSQSFVEGCEAYVEQL